MHDNDDSFPHHFLSSLPYKVQLSMVENGGRKIIPHVHTHTHIDIFSSALTLNLMSNTKGEYNFVMSGGEV